MAESIKKTFDTGGSPLAVPVSPANGVTPDAVSIQGNSLLHYEYSNIGDPNLSRPAYNNIGVSTTAYSLPKTAQLGLAANTYQGATNRYINNAPENRSF